MARPGRVLVNWDFRSVEFFVLAALSGDEALSEVLISGRDVYRFLASSLFTPDYDHVGSELRERSKVLGLSIMYGRTPYGVATELGLSVATAKLLVEAVLALFPQARDFLGSVAEYTQRERRCVSLLGRVRRFPGRLRRDALRRKAVNTVVQASAATVFKERLLALEDVLAERGLGRTLIPLHDGGLLEVHEDRVDEVIVLAREVLPATPLLPLDLPVKVGVGRDWAEAEESAV
jgi:DNA polymerase-1